MTPTEKEYCMRMDTVFARMEAVLLELDHHASGKNFKRIYTFATGRMREELKKLREDVDHIRYVVVD